MDSGGVIGGDKMVCGGSVLTWIPCDEPLGSGLDAACPQR